MKIAPQMVLLCFCGVTPELEMMQNWQCSDYLNAALPKLTRSVKPCYCPLQNLEVKLPELTCRLKTTVKLVRKGGGA